MTKQIVCTLLVRVLLIAAGFISSVITARFLGPEGRGIFFYWTTIAAFCIQFGNLGLHSSNTFLLTKGRAHLSALAANSLWASIFGGVLLGGLLVLSLWLINTTLKDTWPLLLPAMLLIPSGLYFLLGTNLLVAEGRIGEYNGFELANRYLGIAVTIFAAWYWRSPQSLLAVMSIVSTLLCFPLYRRLRVLGGAGRVSMHLIREGFGYALRAYIATAVGFAVLRVNAMLLEKFMDTETLGIWSIASQLLDVIIVIPSTIALVLFSRIMRSDQPYQLMRSQLNLTALFLSLVCAVTAWLGQDIILLIYGQRFATAYEMLLWGMPGIFALGMVSIISQYLASEGMPIILVWIWIVGLGVELGLSNWLIPSQGGKGAMLSLSIAYLVIFCMVWILAAKHNRTQRMKING